MCRISFALCVRHGASKVCGMIYMHGAPSNVRQLAGALEMSEKQEQWQEYVADALCAVYKAIRPKSKIPYYSEVNQKKEDDRSGQEIVNDIIKRRRRNKRRKEANMNETI